jgi:hypothetical protein
VNIYYLHAKTTMDDMIFSILQKKSLITTGVTDGHKVNMGLKDKKLNEIDYNEIGADGTTTIKACLDEVKKPQKIEYFPTPPKTSIVA